VSVFNKNDIFNVFDSSTKSDASANGRETTAPRSMRNKQLYHEGYSNHLKAAHLMFKMYPKEKKTGK